MRTLKAVPRELLNTKATAPAREGTPSRDYLGWLASITPGRPANEQTDWNLMEADRLDERRLEELSQEVYGY